MTTVDVLIIGGGAAGLSTAWHLGRTQPSLRVLLLERNPHLAAESSALNAAILRTVDEDPITTAVAARSARFLRAPPADFSDVPLVDARGLVLMAEKGAEPDLAAWAVGPADAPIRSEPIDAERLHGLHPWAKPSGASGLYFPDEGRIDIAALMAGFARGARRAGVVVRRHAHVVALEHEGARVTGVRLDGGERIAAGTTVIAAGGWATALGRAAGSRVRLRATRRHLLVTRPDGRVRPEWPVFWQLGTDGFYARPESGGMLLCACDLSDVDPDRCDRDDGVREAIARKAARHLPELMGAGVGHFWCGLRTLSADGRFVVGPDADRAGLFWVAGLAGAGMVCSAEVGRIAASLLGGSSVAPDVVAALSPGRSAVRG